MAYDYREAVKADVKQWIEDNDYYISDHREDREEFEQWLNEELWTADSVTGNASGSYTFSAYDAEEYLMHNLDLLAEAGEEFGEDIDILKKGAEYCDVTIRCYLLGQVVYEVCEELEEAGYFETEEEENSIFTATAEMITATANTIKPAAPAPEAVNA